nr:hypothetical protein [Tanacetum cinerariifolium]
MVGAVDEALNARRFISWRVNCAGRRTTHVMKTAKPNKTIKANGVIHFQYLLSQPKQPPLGLTQSATLVAASATLVAAATMVVVELGE